MLPSLRSQQRKLDSSDDRRLTGANRSPSTMRRGKIPAIGKESLAGESGGSGGGTVVRIVAGSDVAHAMPDHS